MPISSRACTSIGGSSFRYSVPFDNGQLLPETQGLQVQKACDVPSRRGTRLKCKCGDPFCQAMQGHPCGVCRSSALRPGLWQGTQRAPERNDAAVTRKEQDLSGLQDAAKLATPDQVCRLSNHDEPRTSWPIFGACIVRARTCADAPTDSKQPRSSEQGSCCLQALLSSRCCHLEPRLRVGTWGNYAVLCQRRRPK